MSKAWIAAFSIGLLLSGCGGSSSGSSGSSSQGSDSQQVGGTTGGSTGGSQAPDNSNTPEQPEAQPEKDRSAVLSWEAPSTRVNGEPISDDDLVQYEIRYGTDPASLDQSVVVTNVQGLISVSHEIDNLADGTWYFSILAQDNNGLVSPPSAPVSKTI